MAMPVETRRSLGIVGALFVAVAGLGAAAGPTDLDLVCSGNSYSKLGDPFPDRETISLETNDKTHVTIILPGSDKPTKAKIISSNPIQLKFSTAEFTGEYFNFSGDLFLIHKDGRLTRLVCTPKA
jgi:hypothetical protein